MLVSMHPPKPFLVYMWSSQLSRASHSAGGQDSTSLVKSTVVSIIRSSTLDCFTSKAETPGSHKPSPKNVFSGSCVTPVDGFTAHGL